jgi:multicomponent Na+:H+ antiporter subunit C
MSVVMAAMIAVLFGAGTYLLLQRALTRIVLGLALIAHAANLLLLKVGGPPGAPPFIGSADEAQMADPLPQALALTAIVISFGMTAFLLALAHRSWKQTGDDEVEDDVEDRRIARIARRLDERDRRRRELEDGIDRVGADTGVDEEIVR